jgi:hypothetical protein
VPEDFVPEDYSEDDFVEVFASRGVSARIEVETVHGLLESAGLKSLIVRENVTEIPTGRVAVRVLASDAEEARALIRDAREAAAAEPNDQDAS